MNYMSEVAKMLGVEIGQFFEINKNEGKFFLCYDGLYHVEGGFCCEELLARLLSGKYTIKRTPWRPEYGEDIWYVDADGVVARYVNFNSEDSDYMNYYKLGNCYRTQAEAEANRDKWIAFYASDEVLEV